jgi:hypothetical protein
VDVGGDQAVDDILDFLGSLSYGGESWSLDGSFESAAHLFDFVANNGPGTYILSDSSCFLFKGKTPSQIKAEIIAKSQELLLEKSKTLRLK